MIYGKYTKVKLFGSFMEQTFDFKNSDYDKVITILKEKLPNQAHLEIIYNKNNSKKIY